MFWNEDGPVDQSRNVRVGDGSGVENAEEGAIFGRGMLAWW
jgi:hypothetical protein